MTLVVARIPYLNTDPFFFKWTYPEASVLEAFPKKLGALAERGAVDAGLLSLVDSWRLEADFEPMRPFGIAVKGAAKSVMLFSKRPPERLDGARIGITDQTSTSVQLLKILMRHDYQVEPRYRMGFRDSDDARLMIGDDALLKQSSGLAGFASVLDLGREWARWTKLPFVFARWMVRRAAPAHFKRELAARLETSLRRYERQKSRFVSDVSRRRSLPEKAVRDYLSGFCFRLGGKEEAAETLFRRFVTRGEARCSC
ncbi:MAG: menaquinone biosynthesis protein [Elusimicrobia bacterium]|nr:menaquinone biosynthesis protein [Elusimicrobiota bacterium]